MVIFYQHFGSFYVAEKNVPTTLELLKQFPYYLNGLRFLKEQQDQGNLYVMKTYALLRYVRMYLSTKVTSESVENTEIYTINNYEEISDLSFFNGLTIYIENPKKMIRVFYRERELSFVRNGLDARARYSITIKYD